MVSCPWNFPVRNILLINPWVYDFAAYDFWMKPLGLLYIAAVLERHTSCRLDLIDCLGHGPARAEGPLRLKPDGRGPYPKVEVPKPAPLKRVPRRYSRYGIPVPLFREALDRVPIPDLVLMTCTMTYWYPGVQTAVDLVRKKFGGVPIVLGGVYPTLMPTHAAGHTGADIIVRGAGENKILPLVREVLGAGPFNAGEFAALDDLPDPAFGLLRDRTWLPLLTSRGCPYRCSFCASRLLYEGFEQRPPSSVVAEIERSSARFGTKHFAFYDDALFLNKSSHLVPILESVLVKGLNVSFHTPNGVHVREIDEEFARLLRRAGVKSIYLSQESVDGKLLKERSPKVLPGDLARALACLEKAGYVRGEISVYLIVGLPGQDAATIRESIRAVRELGAVPRLAHFSPIPGTPEFDTLARRGVLAPDADPLLHNKTALPYLGGDLSPEDLAEIRKILLIRNG